MPGNNDIEDKRKQIDGIDLQILELLNKRANIALDIRNIKQENGMPLFDPKREEDIVQFLCDKNTGPLYDENIRHIYAEILKIMRGLPDAK